MASYRSGLDNICPICKGSLSLTSSNVGVTIASAQIKCVSPQVGTDSYCGATWFLSTKDSF